MFWVGKHHEGMYYSSLCIKKLGFFFFLTNFDTDIEQNPQLLYAPVPSRG